MAAYEIRLVQVQIFFNENQPEKRHRTYRR